MIRSSSMVFSPSICFLRLVLMLTRLAVIKVLYDYAATIEEEFDFQAEDVIAVTSTSLGKETVPSPGKRRRAPSQGSELLLGDRTVSSGSIPF